MSFMTQMAHGNDVQNMGATFYKPQMRRLLSRPPMYYTPILLLFVIVFSACGGKRTGINASFDSLLSRAGL